MTRSSRRGARLEPALRRRLLATSMITSATLLAAAGAHAQTSTSNVPVAGEIVVTGTRLRQPNLTSLSPITAVSADDFRATGSTDASQLMNQLPQVAVGKGFNNSPNPLSNTSGITTVNLRNLGPTRTLVLVDGRRLMPGDPTLGGNAPNIDTIPQALITRTDVVTGGASTVYGSDAVAGVVNFILRHDFQGVQLDAQYGVNQHDNDNRFMQGLERSFGAVAPSGSVWDGRTYNATLTFGANAPDDKGNVTGYISYRHADPVRQGERDYSACQLSQSSGTPSCSGSSSSNLFKDEGSALTYSVSGNQFVSGAARNQSLTPPALFNSNPYLYLARGDERYLGGFLAHYQVTPFMDLYSDFSFMDDRTKIHAAPSALFQQDFNVNCNNPFLSAQQQSLLTCALDPATGLNVAQMAIGRRNIEGGARDYTYQHQSYRVVVGARGDFGQGWHYDIYGQFGRTNYNYSVGNDISLAKAQNALLVNPATGACYAGSGCVPYNIFSDGGVSAEAVRYISTMGTQTGDTQEQVISANLSGNLDRWGVKSPWANSGVAVSMGVEYRREQLDLVPDETSLSGDLAGSGGASPPVHGAFDVKEVFGELGVPVVQGMRFVDDLSLEGGARTSSYSSSGDVYSWKLGMNYAPDSQVRFRGAYNRAVRAPNVNELFTPQLITNGTVVSDDPCAAIDSNGVPRPAQASLAACMRTGVTAAQYGNGLSPLVGGTNTLSQCPAGQCGLVQGGNTALRPEISNTWSGGVVFTPRFVRGLNLSIDYFSISVDGAISTVPANITLSRCLTSGADCNLIVRQANGSLFGSNIATGGYIAGQNLNVGKIQTEGVDFTANYRLALDSFGLQDKGVVTWRFDGTWTSRFTFEPVSGLGTYNCAGLFGTACQDYLMQPTWRHQLSATYQTPWNVSVMGRWRYIGGSRYAGNETNPLLSTGEAFDALDAKIGAVSYLDVSVSWRARQGVTLRAGVNNLLDADPPLIDANVAGSGLPNTLNAYDLLGRQLFVGLTAAF